MIVTRDIIAKTPLAVQVAELLSVSPERVQVSVNREEGVVEVKLRDKTGDFTLEVPWLRQATVRAWAEKLLG